MHSLGARLRRERQRLGLKREEFAAAGGVKRRAQISYEQDERHPDAGYLQAIVTLGVDVQFLLTGSPAAHHLNNEEAGLLTVFRQLDPKNQARLLGLAEGLLAGAAPDSAG